MDAEFLRLAGVLLLAGLTACSEPAPKTPEGPSHAARSAGPTPGMCGPWETTDSARLGACLALATQRVPPGRDTLFGGDCGYQQTVAVDSLRACLRRADSAAAACPLVDAWVMHQPDGESRRGEWRRCGAAEVRYDSDSIVWPLHFLLVRRDTAPAAPAVFVYSNTEEPGAFGVDTAIAVDFDGDGYDELFFVDQVYGTGAIFETCALTVSEGRFRCWSGPDFTIPTGGLRRGEALFKGWIPVAGPPLAEEGGPMVLETGRSFWYTTQVYRDGDANCCPSAGASLWVESRPDSARFAPGLLLRVREDSLGTPLGVDALRQPEPALDDPAPARVTLRATTGWPVPGRSGMHRLRHPAGTRPG